MEHTQNKQADPQISWTGSFPQNYDDYLGQLAFGPYAADLVSRIDTANVTKVLELACGTGQVTQPLIAYLPATAHLVATDLSTDMMAVAKSKITAANITWQVVDMMAIPYADNTFDLVVCQFGLMFPPDKVAALKEMHRVLKPGGKILFNTWGPLANNKAFQVFDEVMNKLVGHGIAASNQGPFALPDEKVVLNLMEQAGFTNSTATSVTITGSIDTAANAVKGFFQGSVLSVSLKEKNAALATEVSATLEHEFTTQLGNHPMRSPLQAWVFTATK